MEVAVEEVATAAPGGAWAGPWRAPRTSEGDPGGKNGAASGRAVGPASLSPPASPAQVSRAARGAPAPHMLVISIVHDVMASAAEVQRPLPEEQGAPRIPPPLTQPQARRGEAVVALRGARLAAGAERNSIPPQPGAQRRRRRGSSCSLLLSFPKPGDFALAKKGGLLRFVSRAPALLQPCEGHARPQKPPANRR